MSGDEKGSHSDPKNPARRIFMRSMGTAAAACAASALGIRCGKEEGWDARREPDRRDVSVEGYFRSRFGLGLDNVYWGDLHTHSLYSFDAPVWCRGPALPEDSCRFARDPEGGNLDFLSLTDHAEIPPARFLPSEDVDLWQSLLRISREFNNEDPAVGKPLIIFPGWEYTNTHMLRPWIGTDAGYGHKCVIFKDLVNVPPTRLTTSFPGSGSEAVARDAAALGEGLADFRPPSPGSEGSALTIPHTPSMNGKLPSGDHRTDWNYMDEDFVRNVEICSKHGNAEGPPPIEITCGPEESLIDYIPDRNDETITLRRLLYQRWVRDGNGLFRISFVGGTDNHMGQPGNDVVRQCDPTGGVLPFRGTLTGIAAPTLTRDALWSGLWHRHTLATTTGPKRTPVLMAVETAGKNVLMGENGKHDGAVRLRVLAPSDVERIEVVVDGCLLFTVSGGILDEELALDEGRHYLYVRAARTEHEDPPSMSWSSPVYLEDQA